MHDAHDSSGIPVSAGVPKLVVVAVIVGIIVIFGILTLVFSNSGFGRVWPSANSTTIKLPS